MTDIFAPAPSATAVDESARGPRAPLGLFRFAGVALAAFPILLSAGMVFSPPQTEPGAGGYIASLAADPTVSLLSANFLHYAWVALALGVMGVIGLVTSRRGRGWVAVAAVAVAFGSVQLSGLLLSDWFLISAGNNLTIEQALAMDAGAKEITAGIWLITAQVFTMIGVPVLSFGLARARVVSWWIAPLPLIAFVVPMLNLGPVAAIAVVPLMAPIFVAALRLIRMKPVA